MFTNAQKLRYLEQVLDGVRLRLALKLARKYMIFSAENERVIRYNRVPHRVNQQFKAIHRYVSHKKKLQLMQKFQTKRSGHFLRARFFRLWQGKLIQIRRQSATI